MRLYQMFHLLSYLSLIASLLPDNITKSFELVIIAIMFYIFKFITHKDYVKLNGITNDY